MQTIGEVLKEARLKKRYSRAKLEDKTKIKEEFIKAIEEGNWQALPDFSVVLGFVKSIAQFLGANEKRAVALLRRDYPPKKVSLNPKPDFSKRLIWSPKLTFLLGAVVTLAVILGYLGFQYWHFISGPMLTVYEPKEDVLIQQRLVKVSGKTDTEASIKVNNQPVLVQDDGKFVTEIEVFKGTDKIEIRAISRSGKETSIQRRIDVQL